MKFYKKLGNKPWVVSFLARLIKAYLVFVFKTTRWTYQGFDVRNQFIKDKKSFIAAFWHGRLMMMRYAWSPKFPKMHVLISLHRDGRIIAKTMEILDLHVISGSSKKGGQQAILDMLRVLKQGEYVTITPDGPKGPAMRVQGRIIEIAQEANVPILPGTFSKTRGKRLTTWDKHLFPLPFGKGVFIAGEPLYIPQDVQDTKPYRQELENRLNKITQEADLLCHQSPVLPDEI